MAGFTTSNTQQNQQHADFMPMFNSSSQSPSMHATTVLNSIIDRLPMLDMVDSSTAKGHASHHHKVELTTTKGFIWKMEEYLGV